MTGCTWCTEQLFHRFRHIRIRLEALLPDGRTEHSDQAFAFCAELLRHHINGFRQGYLPPYRASRNDTRLRYASPDHIIR